MSYLKYLSLLLILGCLAVQAAEKEKEKEATDSGRIIGDQGIA